jgi:hypothetical protein
LKDVPPEKVTEIMALIDKGSYDEANRAIAALTVPRSVRINIDYRQAQGADQDIGLLGQSAMAASPTNVTVNMPRAADARDVTGALDRWARTNG